MCMCMCIWQFILGCLLHYPYFFRATFFFIFFFYFYIFFFFLIFFFFFLLFFFFVFLALFGLFISFLFSFNLLERLKRSAFQRRPRMIPCLLAAAAMVMRYGRLCAEKRSGHVHYLPTSPYHAPHALQMPAGASGAPNEHHK